jgi:hypothetical protein
MAPREIAAKHIPQQFRNSPVRLGSGAALGIAVGRVSLAPERFKLGEVERRIIGFSRGAANTWRVTVAPAKAILRAQALPD